MKQKLIIEFIGTFFLVLVVGLSRGNALAIGGVLAAMVYLGGYISGAHYNPAVTVGVWWQKKIKPSLAGWYMLVQLLAAVLAAAAYNAITVSKLVIAPAAGVSFGAALLTEILFTFALVSVILHTAVNQKTDGNQYYGLAIGFVLMAAVFAGGKISGGAFNPAVGLGPYLYNWGAMSGHWSNFWLYLLGPLAGGVLASFTFDLTAKN